MTASICRTVAESRHYKIIEKVIPDKVPMQKYYSILFLDDSGKEIGWDKAYSLQDAFDTCYAEIHYRATKKRYVYRKNRDARRNG